MPAARYRAAAVQMVSAPSVDANLAAAEQLIAEAAERGARLVALPEWFCFLGAAEGDKLGVREQDGAGPIQSFLARAAARYRVWLIGGTLPLICAEPDRVRNACLVFDDLGRRMGRYDKIH